MLVRRVRRLGLTTPSKDAFRAFSSHSARMNKEASNQEEEDPLTLLNKGFKAMDTPGYRKNPKDLNNILNAGSKVGLSKEFLQGVYERVEPGTDNVPYLKLPREERRKIDKEDLRILEGVGTSNLPSHPEFEYDDIPSLGHLQVQNHRVQREYIRAAAYELPRLSKLSQTSKPYVRPIDKPFRFKYLVPVTESLPGQGKVSVEFKVSKLGLNEVESHKLKVLAGTRYDPRKDTVKISSSRYQEQAQNKTYLHGVITDLITHAKDKSDTFEDIPLDKRHIEAKERRQKKRSYARLFPEEWKRPQDAPKVNSFVSKLGESATIKSLS